MDHYCFEQPLTETAISNRESNYAKGWNDKYRDQKVRGKLSRPWVLNQAEHSQIWRNGPNECMHNKLQLIPPKELLLWLALPTVSALLGLVSWMCFYCFMDLQQVSLTLRADSSPFAVLWFVLWSGLSIHDLESFGLKLNWKRWLRTSPTALKLQIGIQSIGPD